MPGKSTAPTLVPFLFVGYDATGQIASVQSFRTNPKDGLAGGKSRALIAGVKRYQVYRLNNEKRGDLEFERLR